MLAIKNPSYYDFVKKMEEQIGKSGEDANTKILLRAVSFLMYLANGFEIPVTVDKFYIDNVRFAVPLLLKKTMTKFRHAGYYYDKKYNYWYVSITTNSGDKFPWKLILDMEKQSMNNTELVKQINDKINAIKNKEQETMFFYDLKDSDTDEEKEWTKPKGPLFAQIKEEEEDYANPFNFNN